LHRFALVADFEGGEAAAGDDAPWLDDGLPGLDGALHAGWTDQLVAPGRA
jgi:hypothetical protein